MSLIRWKPKQSDPFKDFFNLEHPYFGLSLFPIFDQAITPFREGWYPAVDVHEDKDNIYVKADLPGLNKKDIRVSIEDNILRIMGERKSEAEKKERSYHRFERSYGYFERVLNLGASVDQSKANAKYKNGVLEMVLPKTEKNKAQEIVVED